MKPFKLLSLCLLCLILAMTSVADEDEDESDDDAPKTHEKGEGPRQRIIPLPRNGDAGICDDIYKATCAPGVYNDGTGEGASGDVIEEKANAIKRDLAPELKEVVRKAFVKPENAHFRRIVLSALGLTNAPVCLDETQEEKCISNAVEGVSKHIENQLYQGPQPTSVFGVPTSVDELEYLLEHPVFEEIRSAINEKAKPRLTDKVEVNKVKTMMPRIKTLLAELVMKKVANPQLAEMLREKIEGIRFDGTDCYELVGQEKDKATVSSMLIPNAYYDPTKNTFRYCFGLLLQSGSEFQLASVITHEVAHSIDPCVITKGAADYTVKYSNPKDAGKSEDEFPFPGLLKCLRTAESVAALRLQPVATQGGYGGGGGGIPLPTPKTPDPFPGPSIPNPLPIPQSDGAVISEPIGQDGVGDMGFKSKHGPHDLPPTPPQGGAFGSFPQADESSPFCASDQIGEAFADWASAEILPKYMATFHENLTKDNFRVGYANAFRGICDGPAMQLGFDEHPPLKARVNKILLAQPQIRKQMGCPETVPEKKYCEVKDNANH